jgi:hypothetical protein
MKRCWEYKNCGEREDCAVYQKYKDKPIVPLCWYVAGTMCGGQIQGGYAKKIDSCRHCDYFLYLSKKTTLKRREVA